MAENLSPYQSWGKFVALAVLFLAFTYNLLARYLLIFQFSLPLEDGLTPEQRKYQSIKEALGLSASQYGLLTGPAFMAVFALFNLFSGFVADNFNRRVTMTLGLFCTSLSIGLMYWVREFWQLFLLRALLAAGQAFFGPLGYSMIAAFFPDYKTTANSIFASGVYSGYGLASLALVFLPMPHVGWRNLSGYVALFGAVLSTLFFFAVWEPRRPQAQIAAKAVGSIQNADQNDQQSPLLEDKSDGKDKTAALAATPSIQQFSWFQSVRIALSSPHVLVLIAILIPRLCGGGVLGAFFPVLMKNRFPHMKTKFAGFNAIVVSSGGILSSFLGGLITDKWVAKVKENARLADLEQTLLQEGDYDSGEYRSDFGRVNFDQNGKIIQNGQREQNDQADLKALAPPEPKERPPSLKPYLYVAALSCLLSLGAFAGVMLSQNLYLAMSLLFVAYIFSECYFGPLLSVFYTTTTLPNNVRSTALSVSLGIAQLVASFAPVLVGIIEDKAHNLQTELLIGVLAPNATAGIIALITGCAVH